jgi:hypothetical protein
MVKREARKSTSVNIWVGGSCQCRRGLANLCRFVGWCAGNGYLLYTRLLMLFFEMTLNCLPRKLGPIKQHQKINKNMNYSLVF